MTTILEKIKNLIKDYRDKKKKVEEVVDATLDLMESTTKTLEQIEKGFNQIEITFKNTNEKINDLSKDYESMKQRLDKMRNNFWYKLFGFE